MSEGEAVTAAPKGAGIRSGRWVAGGCAVAVVVLVVLPAGGIWAWRVNAEKVAREAAELQVKRADEEAAPAIARMRTAGLPEATYDIDQTVRVIHEIDLGMKDQATMADYLGFMAAQDYRGVAPEVMDARRELLLLQSRLYAKETESEDQKAAWEFSRDLMLGTASVVRVDGAGLAGGTFSVDSVQARRLLEDLSAKEEERRHLERDIVALQDELFRGMLDYSAVYYRYVDEWDRLCVLRDRAYLGVANGDWATARDASRAAIAMAPHEKEAHLLLAMALIQGGDPESYPEAGRLLDTYIQEHPGANAPAFLLRGVLEEKMGDTPAANLDFQQSAAYYPKQASALTEMLDPYKMREFLRKSREGNYILDVYQASMLGAGYFSPDLQLAKVAFAAGDRDGGKRKIMDHFARRRSQGEWAFLLQDISYAQDLLGSDFQELFPENSYLDLVVKPTLFGDKLSVGINNRSGRALHNATLILVVHFTDTHPGDYEPFAAERTQPAVLAHEVTDFGEMSVRMDLWGKSKSVGDIVEDRAILVTDEAVMWVDSDAHKIAEAKEFREAARRPLSTPDAAARSAGGPAGWRREMSDRLAVAASKLGGGERVVVEKKYGFNDDLVIEVPAELSVFRPVFTLQYGGQTLTADTNVIDGDHIQLRFKGVADFDGENAAPAEAVRLVMDSVFGAVVMDWSPGIGAAWAWAGQHVE